MSCYTLWITCHLRNQFRLVCSWFTTIPLMMESMLAEAWTVQNPNFPLWFLLTIDVSRNDQRTCFKTCKCTFLTSFSMWVHMKGRRGWFIEICMDIAQAGGVETMVRIMVKMTVVDQSLATRFTCNISLDSCNNTKPHVISWGGHSQQP